MNELADAKYWIWGYVIALTGFVATGYGILYVLKKIFWLGG